MSDPTVRFDVFLSSTWIDFREIRPIITDAIQIAGYVVRGMEQFPAMSDEVFEYIKKVINECSYYVLITGTRYGSISPKYGKSYTHLEFEYAKSLGMPILCFMLSDSQLKKVLDHVPDDLANFRNILMTETQINKSFVDQADLPRNIVSALAHRHGRDPQKFWINLSGIEYQDIKKLKSEGLVGFDCKSNLVDDSKRIRNSKSLIAILNDGYGWIPKYRSALEQRFANKNKTTTIILMDPDADVVSLIAERSNKDLLD